VMFERDGLADGAAVMQVIYQNIHSQKK
jgi:hypothetical protein